MADREKIISEFEDFVKSFSKRDDTYYKGLFVSVLALLKEQDVVRCKDCKNVCVYDDDEVICTHIDSNGNDKHPADWFCADGERKEQHE